MFCARNARNHTYAEPLDIAALARIALVSEVNFMWPFGETPRRHL